MDKSEMNKKISKKSEKKKKAAGGIRPQPTNQSEDLNSFSYSILYYRQFGLLEMALFVGFCRGAVRRFNRAAVTE
jgi:hypothetical protein